MSQNTGITSESKLNIIYNLESRLLLLSEADIKSEDTFLLSVLSMLLRVTFILCFISPADLMCRLIWKKKNIAYSFFKQFFLSEGNVCNKWPFHEEVIVVADKYI